MAAEPALRRPHDALCLLGTQPQIAGAERHHDVLAQRTLAIGHRLVDDVGHADVALHRGSKRRVGSVDAVARPVDVGHEIAEHDLLDAGLAERRQHLLDVAQEHPVGTDDQHALILQREPVRVQQVRGAVQRHDRLAGSRAALHHQHPGLWAADDLVLLGLDGGDDVAELAGAASFQCGEQRAVAAEAGVGAETTLSNRWRRESVVVADAEVAFAEQLVLQTQQGAALHGEVPASGEAHRLASGGTVERLGDGRPPVDDDRFALLVGDRQSADVERLQPVGRLGHPVDAAEHQRGIAEVELGQPVDHGLVEHIALVARLKRAAEGALVEVSHPPSRIAADLETPCRRAR